MDLLIEKEIQQRLLVPREQRLLSLLFKKDNNKDNIDHLLQDLNIDQDNRNYLLMLAHYGFHVNWKGFSEQDIPQLKGIYRYYQAQNAVMLQKLLLYIRKLNENGISPLLLKGSAIRLHYAPSVSRMMADVDIALEAEDYEKALAIVKELGAEWVSDANHSVTYRLGQTKMDIHHSIFKNKLEEGSDIWRRVEQIEANGCQVKVLSPIDMFVHLLDTQSRCIFNDEMPNRRMKWLFDARTILNIMANPDWQAIAKRANELNCSYRIHLMMKLFSTCYPELISIEQVKDIFKVDQGYAKWLKSADDYHKMLAAYLLERKAYALSITFSVVWLQIKHRPLWKQYKYHSYELKQLRRINSFAQYVVKHYQLNKPSLFYQKYLSRIRLR